MKIIIGFFFIAFFPFCAIAQIPVETQKILEKYIENSETQDDVSILLDELLSYYENPLKINSCTQEELLQFPMISPVQAVQIYEHRQRFGLLLEPAELQVCGLDPELILVIQSFITFELSGIQKINLLKQEIQHSKLQWLNTLKVSLPTTLNDSALGKNYTHSMRFKMYHQHFSIGITAEKDAGERYWYQGKPEFITANLAIQNIGKLKYLVLGDYTLHFGQGLVIGSGIGMGKGANILNIKRSRLEIKPYRSLNEYNYFRGGALQIQWLKNLRWQFAAAVNALDGRSNYDSVRLLETLSSVDMDGYHRTNAEIFNKGNIQQKMFHTSLQFQSKVGNLSIGYTGMQLDKTLNSSTAYYQLLNNQSNTFSYFHFSENLNYRILHIFSEIAWLKENNSFAGVAGLLVPLGPKIEFSVLYRNYQSGYNSRYNTAFGATGSNESGLYCGMKYNFNRRSSISFFQDFWRQNWLQFQVDGLAVNQDYFIQWDKQFNKKTGFYIRYRQQHSTENSPLETSVQMLSSAIKTQFRFHFQHQLNLSSSIEFRGETVQYKTPELGNMDGALVFVEWNQKVFKNSASLHCRFATYHTQNYQSRIYAFENQLMYDFASTAFYGSGSAFYILWNQKINKKIKLALRYAQTSALLPDEKDINTKRKIGFQFIYQIQ